MPPLLSRSGVAGSPATGRSLSVGVILVWLLQLLFPTICLVHVVWYGNDAKFGRFEKFLFAFCLLWYALCAFGLALSAGRRWIATHAMQLVTLYVTLTITLAPIELVIRSMRPSRVTEYNRDLGWKPIPGASGIGAHGWRRATASNLL